MNARHDQNAPTAARLRLVGRDEPRVLARHAGPERPVGPPERAARRDIARENHSAAAMPAGDPRLDFATVVKSSLEGGRAAILRPERRRDLMTRADALGLRPFDANLVIAVVQEAARRGEDAAIPQRTPQHAHANLQVLSQLLPAKPVVSARDQTIRLAFIAAGIGICILGGLIAAMGR